MSQRDFKMDIYVANRPLAGSIRAISSKSDVHRFLFAAALAGGHASVNFTTLSDDIAASIAALRAAIRMLGAGQCSRRRLYEKLRARRITDADATFAVDTVYAKGYIDEDWQLRSYIRTLTAQKQYGPRKLYAALAAKGYRGDDIRRAMDENFGAEEIRAARRAFLEKKFGKTVPETRDEAAVMRQALYKQGF